MYFPRCIHNHYFSRALQQSVCVAVPIFELYYWSFQLKALHNWVDPQSTVSWRVIEADKVKPNRLQDILFTGTGKKGIIINLVRL